jgi:imidazolonepropionase-like amidohydrolase
MRRLTSSSGGPLFAALFFVTAYSSPAAAQTPQATAVTVFEGARLITGDGSAPIEDSAFIVEGNRFTQIGRKGQVAVPAGAARIDLTGKTVMPAIVDAHGHPGFLDAVTGKMSKANYTRENYIDHLQRYAYHGVAAVLSTGTDMGELAYQLRAEVIPNAALIRTVGLGLAYPGSGPADTSRNDVPSAITSPAEARKAVQELARHKADFVKIWVDTRNGTRTKLSPEMFTAAADEASSSACARSHVFDLADAKLLVKAGVEGFLHSIRDQEVDDEFIKLAKERNVWFTPNLGGINRLSLIRDNGTPAWFDEPLVRKPSRRRWSASAHNCTRAANVPAPRQAPAAGVRHQYREAPRGGGTGGSGWRLGGRRAPLARTARVSGVRKYGGGRLHRWR